MVRRAFWLGMVLLALASLSPTYAEHIDVPSDAISIKVGQVLFVTFSASGDGLVSPHVLPQAPNSSDPLVTLQLTQSGPTRTLLVTNGFDRPLVYRAVARMRGRRQLFQPPVVAVRPGLQSIITLAEPFDELQLFEFHLTNAQ